MPNDALAALFSREREAFIQTLVADLQAAEGTFYAALNNAQREQSATSSADAIIDHFRGTDPVEEFAARIALVRVRDPNYAPEMIQLMIRLIDQNMRRIVSQAYAEYSEEREHMIAAVHDFIFRMACTAYNTYTSERERALNESAIEQERLIEMLRDLSSPIMPVHDSILVLPIVGAIDTRRAQIIMEDLLEAIVVRQADMVIIDITGVPLVDTAIANYLIHTTKAVHLLGAHIILVGISAEVAQTLVGLEVDLQSLTVRANLQDGINYALEAMGLHIQPFEESHVH